MGTILAGALAGTCALTITFPFDVARTRLCTDIGKSKLERKYTGLANCVAKTFQ